MSFDTTNGTRTVNVTSSGLTSVAVTATEADDDSGTGNPGGPHVDNPYAGATGYVNPDWSAKAAAEPGGDAVAAAGCDTAQGYFYARPMSAASFAAASAAAVARPIAAMRVREPLLICGAPCSTASPASAR